MAAFCLDLFRIFEKSDVLFDFLEHSVLTPNIGESSFNFVGHVGVDATFGHEPKNGDELADTENQRESDAND